VGALIILTGIVLFLLERKYMTLKFVLTVSNAARETCASGERGRGRERKRERERQRESADDTRAYFFARSPASRHFSEIENDVRGIERNATRWPTYPPGSGDEFKGYLHNAERPRDDSDSISSRGWAPSPSAASFHELLVLLRHGTYVRLARARILSWHIN